MQDDTDFAIMTRTESQVSIGRSGPREAEDSQAYRAAVWADLGVATISDSADGQHSWDQSHNGPVSNSQLNLSLLEQENIQFNDQALGKVSVVERQDATRPEAQAAHGSDRDPADDQKKQTSTNHSTADACIEVPQSLEPVDSHPPVDVPHDSRPTTQHNARLLNGKSAPAVTAVAGKMDVSQQTPTQVNEDRDYNDICDSLPSNSPHDATKPTQGENDERTLQDGDTGAVDFHESQFGRPSSQVSVDGGFESNKNDWRHLDDTSQLNPNNAFTPFKSHMAAPETPALPKNPFGAKPNIGAPLAGTQLFGQTQFSSAIKPPGISPTSSRPSPNIWHNSISPNVAETSPLKDRANVSSPTDIRTSSPQRLEEVPATVTRPRALERIEEETPSHGRSIRDEAIPRSPTGPPPRSSIGHKPISHYETMKKSQERKQSESGIYDFVGSDSDEDDAIRQMERRKRVERKRAQAAQEMEKVRFTPPSQRNSDEQPSRKKRRIANDVETQGPMDVSKASDSTKSSNELPVVADSQRKEASSNRPVVDESTQGTEEPAQPREALQVDDDQPMEDVGDAQPEAEDRIPATSPALSPSPEPPGPLPQSEPDLPRLGEEEHYLRQTDETGASSMPPATHQGLMKPGRRTRAPRRNTVITSSATESPPKEHEVSTDRTSAPLSSPASTAGSEEDLSTEKPSADVPDVDATPVAPVKKSKSRREPSKSSPLKTRSRGKTQSPTTERPIQKENDTAADSSTSSLSSAPSSPALTTSLSGNSPDSERAASVNLPSSTGGRKLRKQALKAGTTSVSPQPSRRLQRRAKQLAPNYASQSTEDSAPSPPASVAEKKPRQPKTNKAVRQSLPQGTNRSGRLFDGMVFATSFQSNKKSATAQDRTKLEAKISKAGGTVLSKGFEELFERSPIMQATSPIFDLDEPMTLSKAYGETEFTALIADGHSRTAKYLQALALGLPCLAQQWITACLEKGSLVDWEPYLLCSGESKALGNAIRSRNLIPYGAGDARLAEVVDQRRKLIENQKVLVVVDSSRGKAKQPYMFLTQALGPSLSRVFTGDEAREALASHAKDGQPFDWIYVDEEKTDLDSVLLFPETGGKKRKRYAAQPAPWLGDLRVLNDEMLIQSLILGRMVEDDEIRS